MAAVVESVAPKVEVSTLLQLQLRRRERRSKNFLLNLSSKESDPSLNGERLSLVGGVKFPAETPVAFGKNGSASKAPDDTTSKSVQSAKSADELSQELEDWIEKAKRFDSIDLSVNDTSSRLTMPSLVAKDAPSIDPYPKLDGASYTYKGGRDQEKRPNGKGNIELENGCCISGEWRHGKREGKFRMDCCDGSVSFLEGFYEKDKVQGKVRLQFVDSTWITGFAKDSVLHGFCKYYDQDKKLRFIGITRNGKRFGTCWQLLPGGGYIVGKVDAEGELSGPSIAYIYPDHRTAFVGVFDKGEMVKTQAVTITGFETEYNCIKVPIFTPPTGDFYKREVSTNSWITSHTLLEDPYEKSTVFITTSNTPGAEEGLFAARDLKTNTIAAFYNGLRRQKPEDSASTWQLQENAYKIFDPLNKKGVIDIIPEYQSLSAYRASLAHKTNHSFLPNCEFSEVNHPRWGLVPCVMTRQDVKRGEELLVWYGYDLDYCPDWYKDAWENSCKPVDADKLKSG